MRFAGRTLRRVWKCASTIEPGTQGSAPLPLLRKPAPAGAAEQAAKLPHVVESPSAASTAWAPTTATIKVVTQRARERPPAAAAGRAPPVLSCQDPSLPWPPRRATSKLTLPPAYCSYHLQERLGRLTWQRMLEEEEVMRGLSYYGSGTGLRRMAAKLLAGQPVKIVSLGGSITATGGDDPAGEVRGCLLAEMLPVEASAGFWAAQSVSARLWATHPCPSPHPPLMVPWPCSPILPASSSTSTPHSHTREWVGLSCTLGRRTGSWGLQLAGVVRWPLSLPCALLLLEPCHAIIAKATWDAGATRCTTMVCPAGAPPR